MTIRLFLLLATAALAAQAQSAIENWAVPAGMNSNQTISVLGTLNQPVLNRPFSAAATVHMTHTLEDGIHINQTTTAVMYRDAQGRQRTESDGFINIVDPVAQMGMTLNPARHTAVKRSVAGYVIAPEKLYTQSYSQAMRQKAGKAPADVATENLGVQTINGVLCYGGRETITIPVGAIGNDREIKPVKETWTSTELHILVRSVDSDPRFGTSTYELTNIVQAAPDPALFRMDVPSGYTESRQQGVPGQISVGK